MKILTQALLHTADLLLRLGPVMFLSLFGVELMMQMGAMKRLEPLGRPVARLAHLPSESALTVLASLGSMIAAHTMTARFHADGKLSRQEMILSAILNSVPFHFKEAITFHLPVVLPLLGLKICVVYVLAFWLTGLLKLGLVLIYGRFRLEQRPENPEVFAAFECRPDDLECLNRSFRQKIMDAFRARQKLFVRMMSLLASVTFIIQLLVETGFMKKLDALVGPFTAAFGLPPAVIAPISVYIFSPTVGLTYMSNLLNEHLVTEFQAITALLAGGILMVPTLRLRGTLPRYAAIFGFKNGLVICGITAGLSVLSRMILLVLVLLFFDKF